MSCKRFLLVMVMAGLGTVARAQDFGLDIGSFSDPLTGAPIHVDPNNGGTFGFFNSTADPITELSFIVSDEFGKTAADFTCTSFDFFTCQTPIYNGTAGTVTFEFLATESLDGDEGPGFRDSESGEQEGLPTIMQGCTDPDSGNSALLPLNELEGSPLGVSPCTSRGHFLISFNTFNHGQFNPNTCVSDCVEGTQSGGTWADGAAATLETINGKSVPEPSSLTFFGTSLLLIGGIARRRTRRRT